MSELISRQAAIDYFVTNVGFNDEDGYPIEDECELRKIWTDIIEGIPPATGVISRQEAIETILGQPPEPHYPSWYAEQIRKLQPAQQNLSEEYAKAVRNWLVNYQIKCAELKGRYTPYEVLGWIVSDWRKENGIW